MKFFGIPLVSFAHWCSSFARNIAARDWPNDFMFTLEMGLGDFGVVPDMTVPRKLVLLRTHKIMVTVAV